MQGGSESIFPEWGDQPNGGARFTCPDHRLALVMDGRTNVLPLLEQVGITTQVDRDPVVAQLVAFVVAGFDATGPDRHGPRVMVLCPKRAGMLVTYPLPSDAPAIAAICDADEDDPLTLRVGVLRPVGGRQYGKDRHRIRIARRAFRTDPSARPAYFRSDLRRP